jgi:transcriptional regulator with XRE-family HTH domain
MSQTQELLQELRDKGWTISAIANEVGVSRNAVDAWYGGESSPRAIVAVNMMLRSLLDKSPPPQRRYGPDAPQRQPKKDLASDTSQVEQPSP